MLAKTYKSHKDLDFPVWISEKLDGVPGDFYNENGVIKVRSRQGEQILSVDHICDYLTGILEPGMHLIGELYIEGADFKDISGLVRRKESTAETYPLRLYVHDFYVEGNERTDFINRMFQYVTVISNLGDGISLIQNIRTRKADNVAEFEAVLAEFREVSPDAEGVVIRSLAGDKSFYKKGWRSPGLLKHKVTNTVDLPINSFQEALSKDGVPLGMVGRINVTYPSGVDSDEFNDHNEYSIIGVGPGKLTHIERKEIWENQSAYINRIIEIAYMPDDSYNALREARFHRFRPDRD